MFVAQHSFTAACGATLDIIMASDSRQHSVMDFEQSCLDTADSHVSAAPATCLFEYKYVVGLSVALRSSS